MLVIGEIHTGLLPHSVPLTPEQARGAMSLAVGEGVSQWARPVPHTASAPILHGVDCKLPLGPKPGKRYADADGDNGSVRVVGTVSSRAVLTGGHLLQGSAWTAIEPQDRPRRMPWSYYLARPGRIYPIGKLQQRRLLDGFLRADVRRDSGEFLDAGAIARHPFQEVQGRKVLDRHSPFRTASTRLRWAAIVEPDAEPKVRLRLVDAERRRLELNCGPIEPDAVAAAAEDLAVHEWLLTAVDSRISLARVGQDAKYTFRTLRPLVDHLLHLWAPGARTDEDLQFAWDALERQPGLTHQWNTMVERVRGQVDYGAADLADRLLSIMEQHPQLVQRELDPD